MPRPSNKEKRREQVLAAYLSAASRYGVSGATLDVIAKEASMTRPLVRHHLGNKDDMFDLLVTHVVAELEKQTQSIADALPSSRRLEVLIDYLFGQPEDPGPQLIFVFADLTMKSVSNSVLATRLAATITQFETLLRKEIYAEFSNVPDVTANAVAHGIMAIYFNSISLEPLMQATENARNAVNILIGSLRKE